MDWRALTAPSRCLDRCVPRWAPSAPTASSCRTEFGRSSLWVSVRGRGRGGGACCRLFPASRVTALLPNPTGESVDDCGGGYSESIAEMCEELQNGLTPLLSVTPNGRDESGANRDCFLLSPAARAPLHTGMFRFLGTCAEGWGRIRESPSSP